jgi:hypothetical protein
MPEHPVRRKLRDQIPPWLESGKLLQKQWFYRLYVLFGYATDVTVALGSVGIVPPLMRLLVQPPDKPGNTNVLALLPQNPKWLYYLAATCVVGWVILQADPMPELNKLVVEQIAPTIRTRDGRYLCCGDSAP